MAFIAAFTKSAPESPSFGSVLPIKEARVTMLSGQALERSMKVQKSFSSLIQCASNVFHMAGVVGATALHFRLACEVPKAFLDWHGAANPNIRLRSSTGSRLEGSVIEIIGSSSPISLECRQHSGHS